MIARGVVVKLLFLFKISQTSLATQQKAASFKLNILRDVIFPTHPQSYTAAGMIL